MARILVFVVTLFALIAMHATKVSAFQIANETAKRLLTIADDLPSLQIHVHTKRSTLTMFGRSDFNVTVTPVVTTPASGQASVYYNAFVSFVEGQTVHSYHLVDGTAYYTTKSCLPGSETESVVCVPPRAMPPVQLMLEALNTAVPTSSLATDCPGGYLWQATLFNEPYAICTKPATGFTVTGTSFDVNVLYLPSRVEIVAPQLPADQLVGCATTPQPMTVTAATLSLLTGKASPNWGDITPKQQTNFEGSCSCKGKKRACLFVHGLGRKGPIELVDKLDYFGSQISKHAPCCTSIKYASLDTKNYAWHSDYIQERLCGMALAVSNTSSIATRTVSDTIIVTHSMGNLMLGGGIATGKCQLDTSSTWVGLSGPMKGSMASDFVQKVCPIKGMKSFIVGLTGFCPLNAATQSLAYQGEAYASSGSAVDAKYAAAQEAYKANVKAVMCSNGFAGLSWTTHQQIYWGASKLFQHKNSLHDGIVEYQSCRGGLPEAQFSDHYSNPFYVTKLNHLDTTFRSGDAFWNTAKMPVKWFECLL